MFLFDSNIIRHLAEGDENLAKHISKIELTEIALPSIVAAEILRGRADFVLKATSEQLVVAHTYFLQTLELVKTFQIVTFDQTSVEILKTLQAKFSTKKRYADLTIASMVLSGKHILITRNTKHFADVLPKNQLQNWIDE